MNPFVKHIALLLLLLFVRVMVPDSLVVALHSHSHTSHETEKVKQNPALDKVDVAHLHCPVEEMFDTSYFGSHFRVALRPLAHTSTYTLGQATNWDHISFAHVSLRGPPVA